MKLFTYLKGLFHRITRGQIQASCDSVIESLQQHTLPAYVSAEELFKSHRLNSKKAKEMVQEYSKIVGAPKGGQTMIGAIAAVLQNTAQLLAEISNKADTLFSDVESTLGMDFKKATYLRLISAAGFANDYSRSLLSYLYVVETEGVDPQSSLADQLTPAQVAWVEGNFTNFCVVMAVLSKDTSQIAAQINELPDAVVTEQTEETLTHSLGESATDPLGFHRLAIPITIGVKWNPFHLIAQLRADYRVAQYECSKQQLQLLQLHKLNLEKLYVKKPDAALQKQIQALNERIGDLQMGLQEMEKKYG